MGHYRSEIRGDAPPSFAYLTSPLAFGSPYDQADGADVEYEAGTRVRVSESTTPGKVWVVAPNGREALVDRSVVARAGEGA